MHSRNALRVGTTFARTWPPGLITRKSDKNMAILTTPISTRPEPTLLNGSPTNAAAALCRKMLRHRCFQNIIGQILPMSGKRGCGSFNIKVPHTLLKILLTVPLFQDDLPRGQILQRNCQELPPEITSTTLRLKQDSNNCIQVTNIVFTCTATLGASVQKASGEGPCG